MAIGESVMPKRCNCLNVMPKKLELGECDAKKVAIGENLVPIMCHQWHSRLGRVPTGCGNVCKECSPAPGLYWKGAVRALNLGAADEERRRTPGSTGVANGMRTSNTSLQ